MKTVTNTYAKQFFFLMDVQTIANTDDVKVLWDMLVRKVVVKSSPATCVDVLKQQCNACDGVHLHVVATKSHTKAEVSHSTCKNCGHESHNRREY